jgi:hypothetical protein
MAVDPVLFSQQVERERRRKRRDFVSMLIVVATFMTLPLFGIAMLAGWNLISVLLMVLGMFAVVALIGSVVWLITSAGESVTKLFVEPGSTAQAPDGTSIAEAIAAKGDLAEASAAFDALRKAHGGDTVATLRVEAEMYSGPRGDPKKAKELFQRMRKAVDATRDDELYATHRLADLYFGPLGDTDRALAELRRIVQRFPGTRDAEGAVMAIERHRVLQQQTQESA